MTYQLMIPCHAHGPGLQAGRKHKHTHHITAVSMEVKAAFLQLKQKSTTGENGACKQHHHPMGLRLLMH